MLAILYRIITVNHLASSFNNIVMFYESVAVFIHFSGSLLLRLHELLSSFDFFFKCVKEKILSCMFELRSIMQQIIHLLNVFCSDQFDFADETSTYYVPYFGFRFFASFYELNVR
jgi:hypothetical protein